MRNLRLSSGKTYGELEMPEAAPLIFPALDALQDSESGTAAMETKMLESSQKVVADYFDRRAQVNYEHDNLNGVLAGSANSETGEKKFASRYADPNHPANSGSLINLNTSEVLDVGGMKERRRGERRVRRARMKGYEITPEMAKGKRREDVVRRMLKKDVLYMMIVNLPSEEELAAGKQAVREEDK